MNGVILFSCWFSRNNSENGNRYNTGNFVVFGNVSLKTSLPNLYPQLVSVLMYLTKLTQVHFQFPNSWSIPYKPILPQLNNQYMKRGTVTKLYMRNMTMAKIENDILSQIMAPLPFPQIITNLKQSGSRIWYAQQVKITFSLIIILNITKTENRSNFFLTQLSFHCFK